MNAQDPRQLEQERLVRPDPEETIRLSVLADAINPGFFGEIPGKAVTFLAGVVGVVVLVSR